MNYCSTKYKNVKLPGFSFFFKLKRLFNYLINIATFLVFLEFGFSVLSFKFECVLKLFLNIEGQILGYHAFRSSDQEVYCTVKNVPCDIS